MPFRGANHIHVYIPLEEVLQNEVVGMNLVDSQYQFQGGLNVIHKLDCMLLAYCAEPFLQ